MINLNGNPQLYFIFPCGKIAGKILKKFIFCKVIALRSGKRAISDPSIFHPGCSQSASKTFDFITQFGNLTKISQGYLKDDSS